MCARLSLPTPRLQGPDDRQALRWLQAKTMTTCPEDDATAESLDGTLSSELGCALSFDGLDFAEWLTVRSAQHSMVQHRD